MQNHNEAFEREILALQRKVTSFARATQVKGRLASPLSNKNSRYYINALEHGLGKYVQGSSTTQFCAVPYSLVLWAELLAMGNDEKHEVYAGIFKYFDEWSEFFQRPGKYAMREGLEQKEVYALLRKAKQGKGLHTIKFDHFMAVMNGLTYLTQKTKFVGKMWLDVVKIATPKYTKSLILDEDEDAGIHALGLSLPLSWREMVEARSTAVDASGEQLEYEYDREYDMRAPFLTVFTAAFADELLKTLDHQEYRKKRSWDSRCRYGYSSFLLPIMTSITMSKAKKPEDVLSNFTQNLFPKGEIEEEEAA